MDFPEGPDSDFSEKPWASCILSGHHHSLPLTVTSWDIGRWLLQSEQYFLGCGMLLGGSWVNLRNFQNFVLLWKTVRRQNIANTSNYSINSNIKSPFKINKNVESVIKYIIGYGVH